MKIDHNTLYKIVDIADNHNDNKDFAIKDNLKKIVIDLYLDYVNNYLTIECFNIAELVILSENQVLNIVNLGRYLNNLEAEKLTISDETKIRDKKILELQEQIIELKQTIGNIKDDLYNAEVEIDKTDCVYDMVIDNCKTEIEKIQMYYDLYL